MMFSGGKHRGFSASRGGDESVELGVKGLPSGPHQILATASDTRTMLSIFGLEVMTKLMRLVLLLMVFGVAPARAQIQFLQGDDLAGNDLFGIATALDSDFLLVGAPGQKTAYVYFQSGGSWTEITRLTSANTVALGTSVAIADPYFFVSDPPVDRNQGGRVHVFLRDGFSFREVALITPATETSSFGISLSASADLLVVGSRTPVGAAFVFQRTGTTYAQIAHLTPPDPTSGERYGFVSAISNQNIAVGSPVHRNANGLGSAFLYQVEGSAVGPAQELTAPGTESANFGMAVGFSGSDLLVGTSRRDAVYRFRQSQGSWAPAGELSGPSSRRFGSIIASNERWLVSVEEGAVRLFEHQADDWGLSTLDLRIVESSALDVQNSFAAASDWVAVGAPTDESNRGAVHMIDLTRYVARGQLTTPAESATEIALDATLSWAPIENAVVYDVQVSLNDSFDNLMFDAQNVEDTLIKSSKLKSNQVHYSRIRGRNEMWVGAWSPTRSFFTEFQIPPIAVDDAASVAEDDSISIDVLANDFDLDGDSLVFASVTQPDHGTARVLGRFVQYRPEPDYFGSDIMSYSIRDEYGHVEEANITVEVSPVPDAPNAEPDSFLVTEDTIASLEVLANDVDPDGDQMTIRLLVEPTLADATVLGEIIQYAPAANVTGIDSLRYEVSDGTGRVDDAWVSLTIVGVNDPPVAFPDLAMVEEDIELTLDLLSNDEDVEGDSLWIETVYQPDFGTVSIVSSGSGDQVTYRPATDFFGLARFVYQISDGAATDTATVFVTVTPVPDPPSRPVFLSPRAEDIVALTGNSETPVVFSWTHSVDPDGDEVTYSWRLATDANSGSSLRTYAGVNEAVELTIGELAELSDSLGVGLGEARVLMQFVDASDGVLVESAMGSAIQLLRLEITGLESQGEVPNEITVDSVFPNPTSNTAEVQVGLPTASTVVISVYDMLGRQVASREHNLGPGWSVVPSSGQLASGVYLVQITIGSFRTSRVFVRQ
jgi:Bacterial Ig domain/Secretion system C-terminal sorting domain/FG-GAP repeat